MDDFGTAGLMYRNPSLGFSLMSLMMPSMSDHPSRESMPWAVGRDRDTPLVCPLGLVSLASFGGVGERSGCPLSDSCEKKGY